MSQEVTGAGIAAALGAAGPCPTVRWNSKTWKVGHPVQAAKAELEMAVFEIAQANLDAMRPVLKKGQYEAKCRNLDLQIEGGHHKTGGPLWQAVNTGPDGLAAFMLSLLRQNHPEATLDDARGIMTSAESYRDSRRALAVVVPGFFQILVASLVPLPEDRPAALAQYVAEFLASIQEPPSSPTPSASSEFTTP
jgi:hypothetical protein